MECGCVCVQDMEALREAAKAGRVEEVSAAVEGGLTGEQATRLLRPCARDGSVEVGE